MTTGVQQSRDGIHWEPAEEVPYYPTIIEKIKCKLLGHRMNGEPDKIYKVAHLMVGYGKCERCMCDLVAIR